MEQLRTILEPSDAKHLTKERISAFREWHRLPEMGRPARRSAMHGKHSPFFAMNYFLRNGIEMCIDQFILAFDNSSS